MVIRKAKDYIRAFLDFFILFSGISTASNLARTQGRRLLTRGIFLFLLPLTAPCASVPYSRSP